MVKKGTAQLITTLIVIAIIIVFFVRFDGFKRLTDLFKSFGLGSADGDSSGGGETTIVIAGDQLPEGTESGTSSASAAIEVFTEPELAFDPNNLIVANISGLGPVSLTEAEEFLSPQGFNSLQLALIGQLGDDDQKQLDLEKLAQEEIATAIGIQQFGVDFGSPLGAFANPDFFTDEEKAEVGFIDPVTEPTQKEIQEQKITTLEQQVQDALIEFEKTGVFVLP